MASSIKNDNKTVLLLGFSYTGKSTVFELMKKYVDKQPSEIKYSGIKYTMADRLMTTSTKGKTLEPVVH